MKEDKDVFNQHRKFFDEIEVTFSAIYDTI